MQVNWQYNAFSEMTAAQLYAILKLRSQVFVVEQNCVYLDADDKDQVSFHVVGWSGDIPVAYCRVLPPGVSYDEASIGRVATSPAFRRFGLGRQLVSRAVEFTQEHFNTRKITISAQLYLKDFYCSFGFRQVSEVYQEDNIPHIRMQMVL
jgi:ElaA protein